MTLERRRPPRHCILPHSLNLSLSPRQVFAEAPEVLLVIEASNMVGKTEALLTLRADDAAPEAVFRHLDEWHKCAPPPPPPPPPVLTGHVSSFPPY